jgi:hypothetical protein
MPQTADGAVSQRLIPTGKPFGWPTHTAMMKNSSLLLLFVGQQEEQPV